MKKKIIISILLFSVSAWGKSYLLYNPSPELKKELVNRLGAKEVFAPKEKEFLAKESIQTNILKLELDAEQVESLRLKIQSQKNAILQTNPMQKLHATGSPDPYEELQWGLDNSGKDLMEWDTDIDVTTTAGVSGEDVGIKNIQEDPANIIKVAVIDSGVDVEHPDLKNQIRRNEKECAAYGEYTHCMNINSDRKSCHDRFAGRDADGNGYPMDCNGWNVDSKSIPGSGVDGSPKIFDREGHGTHVAGIIAAEKNKLGISGVIQNVEILPVQVGMSAASGDEKEAPTDKIAKAILYAVKSGAKVINLSLGWRFDQDSLLMREMINLALSKNILVVAAAGNDAHHGPVYPCSYEGVICAGAHTVNGELSSFSNYGAHIDVAAPGTKILGTWPANKRSRFFTQDDGYEYMSGTSQAAPHVTGALAKLLNLGFSPNEAFIRLLKGARPKKSPNNNFIRHGNIDLKRSLEAKTGSFVYPVNKSDALIKWEENASERSFVLKLKNLGEEAKNVSISVKKARVERQEGLEILTSSFLVESFKPGETIEKRIFLKAPYRGHGEFLLKIGVKSEDEEKEYFFQAKAVNIIDGETLKSNQEIFPIEDPERLENSTINKFENHTAQPGVDLVAIKSVNDNTFLSLLKRKGSVYEQSPWQKIPVKSPIFLNLSKVDVDLDGKPEYVAALVNIEDRENRETNFFVFDHDFSPKKYLVAPGNSYDNKLAVMPGGFKWAKLGDKKVPAWVGVGQRPEEERPQPGPWGSPAPELKINRLFLLAPEGLKTAALEDEEELPLHILYPSQKSKVEGKLTIISGDSFGFYKKYSTYIFKDALKKINEFELFPYIDLLSAKPLPMAGSMGDNAFFATPSLDGQRIVSIEAFGERMDINRARVEPFDKEFPIMRVLSFDGSRAIYQTRHHLASAGTRLPSKIDLRRIKHDIITTETALYLRSSFSPDLTGELASFDSQGNLIRPGNWLNLGINGCVEAGIVNEGETNSLIYACAEKGKVLKLELSR